MDRIADALTDRAIRALDRPLSRRGFLGRTVRASVALGIAAVGLRGLAHTWSLDKIRSPEPCLAGPSRGFTEVRVALRRCKGSVKGIWSWLGAAIVARPTARNSLGRALSVGSASAASVNLRGGRPGRAVMSGDLSKLQLWIKSVLSTRGLAPVGYQSAEARLVADNVSHLVHAQ